MKSLTKLFLALLLSIAGTIEAQVTTEWVARYIGSGTGNDYATDITTDSYGNIYITGYITNSGNGYDFSTIKYSPSGIVLWTKTYHSGSTDYGYAIAVDASGNVFVTGGSNTASTGTDCVTIKYNSYGDELWVKRYNSGSTAFDQASALALDESGNAYVTGYSQGTGTGNDYLTIKYYPNGDTAWVAKYNNYNGSDIAKSIAVDSLGNVFVTGTSMGVFSTLDYATIKYNSNGVVQWVSRYNGSSNGEDEARKLTIDKNGNVYVTGYSFGGFTGTDYATVKYNSSGAQQWVSRYSGLGGNVDYPSCIVVDAFGNTYVSGQSEGTTTDFDFATVKINPSGGTGWVMRYNGPGNFIDAVKSISLDNLGNTYVTGISRGTTTGDDFTTIKYSPAGTQQWLITYNGPASGYDYSNAIAIDNLGNIYVTGYSTDQTTGTDYTTVKYSQITPCSLNMTATIQGFYQPSSNSMVGDTARVYVRSYTSPYLKIDSAKGFLEASGNGNFYFSNSMNGVNYYLVLKHRNSIETWSKNNVSFLSGSMFYNFSTSIDKAFGNNQIQVDNSPNRFAIYTGDVNQDGGIDLTDLIQVYNHANTFATGYLPTDANGDNFIDLSDITMIFNNSNMFISMIRP